MALDRSSQLSQRLRLTVITDRGLAGERGWLEVVRAALDGGATAIQLRDKEATSGELLQMAREIRALTEQYGALFIVNDRFDVALAAGSDGVHLGDDDLPVAELRRVVPRQFIIGRSADTEENARAAERDGADYLGVGSVFATTTKPEVLGEAIGTPRLARVARAVSIPVVAVGGISAANAAEVAVTGAAGMAVVSAVMAAPDPHDAAQKLVAEWNRGTANR